MSQGLLTLKDIKSNTLNSDIDSDINVQASSANISFVTNNDKEVIIGNVTSDFNTVLYSGNLEIVKALTLENKVKFTPGGDEGGIISSEKKGLLLSGLQSANNDVLVADSTLVGFGNEVNGVTEGLRVKGSGVGNLSIAHDRPNNRSVIESTGEIDMEFCSGLSQTTLLQDARALTPNAGVINSNTLQSNSLAADALQQSQYVSSVQPSSISSDYGMSDLVDPVAQVFTGYDTHSDNLAEMQSRALFGQTNGYPWKIDIIFKMKVVVTKVRLVDLPTWHMKRPRVWVASDHTFASVAPIPVSYETLAIGVEANDYSSPGHDWQKLVNNLTPNNKTVLQFLRIEFPQEDGLNNTPALQELVIEGYAWDEEVGNVSSQQVRLFGGAFRLASSSHGFSFNPYTIYGRNAGNYLNLSVHNAVPTLSAAHGNDGQTPEKIYLKSTSAGSAGHAIGVLEGGLTTQCFITNESSPVSQSDLLITSASDHVAFGTGSNRFSLNASGAIKGGNLKFRPHRMTGNSLDISTAGGGGNNITLLTQSRSLRFLSSGSVDIQGYKFVGSKIEGPAALDGNSSFKIKPHGMTQHLSVTNNAGDMLLNALGGNNPNLYIEGNTLYFMKDATSGLKFLNDYITTEFEGTPIPVKFQPFKSGRKILTLQTVDSATPKHVISTSTLSGDPDASLYLKAENERIQFRSGSSLDSVPTIQFYNNNISVNDLLPNTSLLRHLDLGIGTGKVRIVANTLNATISTSSSQLRIRGSVDVCNKYEITGSQFASAQDFHLKGKEIQSSLVFANGSDTLDVSTHYIVGDSSLMDLSVNSASKLISLHNFPSLTLDARASESYTISSTDNKGLALSAAESVKFSGGNELKVSDRLYFGEIEAASGYSVSSLKRLRLDTGKIVSPVSKAINLNPFTNIIHLNSSLSPEYLRIDTNKVSGASGLFLKSFEGNSLLHISSADPVSITNTTVIGEVDKSLVLTADNNHVFINSGYQASEVMSKLSDVLISHGPNQAVKVFSSFADTLLLLSQSGTGSSVVVNDHGSLNCTEMDMHLSSFSGSVRVNDAATISNNYISSTFLDKSIRVKSSQNVYFDIQRDGTDLQLNFVHGLVTSTLPAKEVKVQTGEGGNLVLKSSGTNKNTSVRSVDARIKFSPSNGTKSLMTDSQLLNGVVLRNELTTDAGGLTCSSATGLMNVANISFAGENHSSVSGDIGAHINAPLSLSGLMTMRGGTVTVTSNGDYHSGGEFVRLENVEVGHNKIYGYYTYNPDTDEYAYTQGQYLWSRLGTVNTHQLKLKSNTSHILMGATVELGGNLKTPGTVNAKINAANSIATFAGSSLQIDSGTTGLVSFISDHQINVGNNNAQQLTYSEGTLSTTHSSSLTLQTGGESIRLAGSVEGSVTMINDTIKIDKDGKLKADSSTLKDLALSGTSKDDMVRIDCEGLVFQNGTEDRSLMFQNYLANVTPLENSTTLALRASNVVVESLEVHAADKHVVSIESTPQNTFKVEDKVVKLNSEATVDVPVRNNIKEEDIGVQPVLHLSGLAEDILPNGVTLPGNYSTISAGSDAQVGSSSLDVRGSNYLTIPPYTGNNGNVATFSFWVKWAGAVISQNEIDYNSNNNKDVLLSGGAVPGSQDGWVLYVGNAGHVELTIDGSVRLTSEAFVVADQWTHIVLRFSPVESAIYVNNVKSSDARSVDVFTAGMPIFVGGHETDDTLQFDFDAYVDSLRWYNISLSDSQVKLLYELELNLSDSELPAAADDSGIVVSSAQQEKHVKYRSNTHGSTSLTDFGLSFWEFKNGSVFVSRYFPEYSSEGVVTPARTVTYSISVSENENIKVHKINGTGLNNGNVECAEFIAANPPLKILISAYYDTNLSFRLTPDTTMATMTSITYALFQSVPNVTDGVYDTLLVGEPELTWIRYHGTTVTSSPLSQQSLSSAFYEIPPDDTVSPMQNALQDGATYYLVFMATFDFDASNYVVGVKAITSDEASGINPPAYAFVSAATSNTVNGTVGVPGNTVTLKYNIVNKFRDQEKESFTVDNVFPRVFVDGGSEYTPLAFTKSLKPHVENPVLSELEVRFSIASDMDHGEIYADVRIGDVPGTAFYPTSLTRATGLFLDKHAVPPTVSFVSSATSILVNAYIDAANFVANPRQDSTTVLVEDILHTVTVRCRDSEGEYDTTSNEVLFTQTGVASQINFTGMDPAVKQYNFTATSTDRYGNQITVPVGSASTLDVYGPEIVLNTPTESLGDISITGTVRDDNKTNLYAAVFAFDASDPNHGTFDPSLFSTNTIPPPADLLANDGTQITLLELARGMINDAADRFAINDGTAYLSSTVDAPHAFAHTFLQRDSGESGATLSGLFSVVTSAQNFDGTPYTRSDSGTPTLVVTDLSSEQSTNRSYWIIAAGRDELGNVGVSAKQAVSIKSPFILESSQPTLTIERDPYTLSNRINSGYTCKTGDTLKLPLYAANVGAGSRPASEVGLVAIGGELATITQAYGSSPIPNYTKYEAALIVTDSMAEGVVSVDVTAYGKTISSVPIVVLTKSISNANCAIDRTPVDSVTAAVVMGDSNTSASISYAVKQVNTNPSETQLPYTDEVSTSYEMPILYSVKFSAVPEEGFPGTQTLHSTVYYNVSAYDEEHQGFTYHEALITGLDENTSYQFSYDIYDANGNLSNGVLSTYESGGTFVIDGNYATLASSSGALDTFAGDAAALIAEIAGVPESSVVVNADEISSGSIAVPYTIIALEGGATESSANVKATSKVVSIADRLDPVNSRSRISSTELPRLAQVYEAFVNKFGPSGQVVDALNVEVSNGRKLATFIQPPVDKRPPTTSRRAVGRYKTRSDPRNVYAAVAQIVLVSGDVQLSLGQEYTEPGVSASFGGQDISDSLNITGTIDVNTPGEYFFTYTVETPTNQVQITKQRKVTVFDNGPQVSGGLSAPISLTSRYWKVEYDLIYGGSTSTVTEIGLANGDFEDGGLVPGSDSSATPTYTVLGSIQRLPSSSADFNSAYQYDGVSSRTVSAPVTFSSEETLLTPHANGLSSTTVSLAGRFLDDDPNINESQEIINRLGMLFNDNVNSLGLQNAFYWTQMAPDGQSPTASNTQQYDYFFFLHFNEAVKVSKFQLWDARRDWTFTEFRIYFADYVETITSQNNPSPHSEYNFTPTDVWDNATPNNTGIVTLAEPVECKKMAFSFRKMYSSYQSTFDNMGVAEMKVWGYQAQQPGTEFTYTGSEETFAFVPGVNTYTFTLNGACPRASGYPNGYLQGWHGRYQFGGAGGVTTATVTIPTSEYTHLIIKVGGKTGWPDAGTNTGAPGGGSTSVWAVSADGARTPILVAGGGGGSGSKESQVGGKGGGFTGSDGTASGYINNDWCGTGGTSTAGGIGRQGGGNGGYFQGGTAENHGNEFQSGCGGGGYYGGGGGGWNEGGRGSGEEPSGFGCGGGGSGFIGRASDGTVHTSTATVSDGLKDPVTQVVYSGATMVQGGYTELSARAGRDGSLAVSWQSVSAPLAHTANSDAEGKFVYTYDLTSAREVTHLAVGKDPQESSQTSQYFPHNVTVYTGTSGSGSPVEYNQVKSLSGLANTAYVPGGMYMFSLATDYDSVSVPPSGKTFDFSSIFTYAIASFTSNYLSLEWANTNTSAIKVNGSSAASGTIPVTTTDDFKITLTHATTGLQPVTVMLNVRLRDDNPFVSDRFSEYKQISASLSFNDPPLIVDPINSGNPVTSTGQYNLTSAFSDPEGGPVSFQITSTQDTSVITASISVNAEAESLLVLTKTGIGNGTVQVTASDAEGNETVHDIPFAFSNQPPSAVGALPNITQQTSFNLHEYFTDPNSDDLVYTVSTSPDPAVATATIEDVGGDLMLTVTPVGGGEGTLVVTATDPYGKTATQSLTFNFAAKVEVTVQINSYGDTNPGTFQDYNFAVYGRSRIYEPDVLSVSSGLITDVTVDFWVSGVSNGYPSWTHLDTWETYSNLHAYEDYLRSYGLSKAEPLPYALPRAHGYFYNTFQSIVVVTIIKNYPANKWMMRRTNAFSTYSDRADNGQMWHTAGWGYYITNLQFYGIPDTQYSGELTADIYE